MRTPPPPTEKQQSMTAREDSTADRTQLVSVVGKIAARDAMRHRRVRLKAWQRAAWIVGAVVVLIALLWLVFFSPLFALNSTQATVTGQGTTIDTAQVRAQIDKEQGVPLPRVDTVALRERILTLNGVKDVHILRDWPHGLHVQLTSREPVVAVPEQGGYVLLDADAVQVATAKSPQGVPVVHVPLGNDLASRSALFAALDVMEALPPELVEDVKTVTATTQDDVRTRLRDGTQVMWGNGERLPLKVRVTTVLREEDPEAELIDVSAPDLPVTR